MNLFSRLKSQFSLSLSDEPDKETTKADVDPTRHPEGSEFEVDGWVPSGFICDQLVPIVGIYPHPIHALIVMCAAVTRLKPPLIFEWGTTNARSARMLYHVSHDYGEHPQASRGYLVQGIPAVHLHPEDGSNTSLEFTRDAGSPSESLFFIDGNHGYESVKRELEGVMASAPKPSLLLQDTFSQSSESEYNIGPHLAVEEMTAKFLSWFSVVKTGMSLPGKHC